MSVCMSVVGGGDERTGAARAAEGRGGRRAACAAVDALCCWTGKPGLYDHTHTHTHT